MKDMEKLNALYEELCWDHDDELVFTHDGKEIIVYNKTREENPNVTYRSMLIGTFVLYAAFLTEDVDDDDGGPPDGGMLTPAYAPASKLRLDSLHIAERFFLCLEIKLV